MLSWAAVRKRQTASVPVEVAEGSPLALAMVDRLDSIRENDLYEDTQLVRESMD